MKCYSDKKYSSLCLELCWAPTSRCWPHFPKSAKSHNALCLYLHDYVRVQGLGLLDLFVMGVLKQNIRIFFLRIIQHASYV